MNQNAIRVVAIGGGAAGFFGAIACAESNPKAQVVLLEAGSQCLAKVRISGGGRCNVTHNCFDPALLVQHYPRGGPALRGALSRFQPQDTVAWFKARGVALKTEADGRMFPKTDNSATIVDCLMQAARTAGVKIHKRTNVVDVQRLKSAEPSGKQWGEQPGYDTFRLTLRSQTSLTCDRLLLATGSSPQGHHLARALGHTIVPPVPSLFTFKLSDGRLQGLAGISVDPVQLRLQVAGKTKLEQTGPLLVTHWGLSGPAVLKLSAWGARILHDCRYQATLVINWLPHSTVETLHQQLQALRTQEARRAIATRCPLPLPLRLWQRLVASAGIANKTRWAEISKKALNQLLRELNQGHYQIQGKGIFKDEFVTCGGINLKQVNFKTMESRCCPGLYLAGEVLDIDGVTGGFNFQSAWTTAWLAGRAMGNRV